jgi:hypothetical protein
MTKRIAGAGTDAGCDENRFAGRGMPVLSITTTRRTAP